MPPDDVQTIYEAIYGEGAAGEMPKIQYSLVGSETTTADDCYHRMECELQKRSSEHELFESEERSDFNACHGSLRAAEE